MKKIIFLLVAGMVMNSVFASEIIPKEKKIYADQFLIPIGKTGKTISLLELSTISMKDLQKLTGKKMSLLDKMLLKSSQNKLRHSINNDGSLNNKKISKYVAKARGGETGFHAGGFFLGLLLGVIGVLIAYLIKDDYKSNRVKWAWIGWGAWIAIVLVSLLA